MTNPIRIARTAQTILHSAVTQALEETREDLDYAYLIARDDEVTLETLDAFADWRDELTEWLDRHPLPLGVDP